MSQPPVREVDMRDPELERAANDLARRLERRSCLGKPYVGSPKAFSFNVPSVRAVGQISIEKGAGKTEKRVSGGACHSSAGPALELRRGFQPKSL
jgi:hypothetical protein